MGFGRIERLQHATGTSAPKRQFMRTHEEVLDKYELYDGMMLHCRK